MPPKAAGKPKGKGKGGGDDDDGAPSGTCNQVKVRHILCEKQSKILEALKEINGYTNEDGTVVEGKRFNVVAQTYSEDKAKDGGLLGWKRREELNGAFAEVAFKLAKGAMTPAPVKTKFGRAVLLICAFPGTLGLKSIHKLARVCYRPQYHLIQVEDRKA